MTRRQQIIGLVVLALWFAGVVYLGSRGYVPTPPPSGAAP